MVDDRKGGGNGWNCEDGRVMKCIGGGLRVEVVEMRSLEGKPFKCLL